MEDYRNFITQMLQRGLSRKNRFRVTIPLPPGIFDSNATLANDGKAYRTNSSFGDLFKQSAPYCKRFLWRDKPDVPFPSDDVYGCLIARGWYRHHSNDKQR